MKGEWLFIAGVSGQMSLFSLQLRGICSVLC